MRIRTKFFAVLLIELASFAALSGLSLWTFARVGQVNESVDQGVRLIARSRRVHSLLKDVVFDLFTPRSYQYLRESVLSPRSLVTDKEWIDEVRTFRAEYDAFMRDPAVRGMLRDEELKVAYEIAVPLSAKAFAKLGDLSLLVERLRSDYPGNGDLYTLVQASKDESVYRIFGELREASFFLTNVFEGYLNRFVTGLQKQARVMQDTMILLFSLLVLLLGSSTVIAVFFLTRGILENIRLLDAAIGRVAAGDFTLSIPVHGKDELSALAVAFGALAGDVKRNVESIPTLLKDVNEAIPDDPDLDHILGLVTEALLREGGTESASIFLAQPDSLQQGESAPERPWSFVLGACAGFLPFPDWSVGDERESGSFGGLLCGGDSSTVVKDLRAEGLDPEAFGLDPALRSLVIVPLAVRKRLAGFCLFARKSEIFTDLAVARLTASADYAAQVIDNVMAYAALSTRRDAEFEALQAQIRPHFLYNVLTGLAALNRMGEKKRLEDSLFALKDMLRYTLEHMRWTRIREEFDFLSRYCELQRLRFDDRFAADFRFDPEVADIRIPKLIVQPLVENAYIHGLEPRPGPGRLDVEARIEGSFLVIRVRDDGRGCDPDELSSKSRVGLANIRERLDILYSGATLELDGGPGKGFCATIRIPAFQTGQGLLEGREGES